MPANTTSGDVRPRAAAVCSSRGRSGPSPTMRRVTGASRMAARQRSSSSAFFSSARRPTETRTVRSAGISRLARSTADRQGSASLLKGARSMPEGTTNTGQRTP